MRSLVLIALLALGHTAFAKVPTQSRAFEDTIKNFLECLRGEMITGWPDYGIPSLKPLHIDDFTLDIDSLALDGVRGNLNVQDLTATGLTDFVYENIKGTIGLIPPSYTVQLDLSFAKVVLDTKYSGNVAIDALALDTFGTGELSLDANNLKGDIGLKATILGGIDLSYLNVWLSMSPLSAFKITGIRDDEAFSAQLSADILANAHIQLQEYAQVIHDMVETIAKDLISGGLGDGDGFLGGIIDRCL